MAESAEDPALYWIEPERRGIIPLDRFHVPDRLARTVRSGRFTVVVDRDFDAVIDGCAQPMPGRTRTWINARIRNLYRKLYERGDCHTVEVYEGDELVGGLYGVSLGRAFFGESMFHRARDASKVALVHLVARLKAGHYRLLDTQFVTEHLRTFGAVEVSRPAYHKLLDAALVGEGDFGALALDRPVSGSAALARLAAGMTPPYRGCTWTAGAAGAKACRRDGAGLTRREPAPGRAPAAAAAGGGERRSAATGVGNRRSAIGQPDIVDRMLDGVQAGTGSKHPAGKDALDLALQRDFVDFDEGIGIGRLGRRARVADPRRHLQRAELHGFADRRIEGDGAAGDLVEAGKHGAARSRSFASASR